VIQVSTAPAFASVGEAMDTARGALGYLAAADATGLAADIQARCLRMLEQADAMGTAAQASFLSAFTTGQGYAADADYSARAWLMHKTGITRGAAAGRTAWARRATTHPQVVAALARGQISESVGRLICQWTDKLSADRRETSDGFLVDAAAGLIVVEHRDRFARFGAEYVEAALSAQGRRLLVADPSEVDDDLVRDVTEILTSLCARLYGRRAAANRARRAVEAATGDGP
jgi:hypothetical protein